MAHSIHVNLRKKLRKFSHTLLSKLFPVNLNPEPMKLESIQNILLVRVNYRIGNILFSTPLLNALAEQFPNAQIDMIVGAPFTTSLIEGMPQINHVYSFPRDLLKQPFKLWKLKKTLNHNKYDLIITPTLLSSSDKLITLFVKAPYKIGFHAKGVFSPFTHTQAFPENVSHEALRPLALMALFSVPYEKMEHRLNIQLSPQEIDAVSGNIPKNAIGIFRDARGKKKIDNEWWKALLATLYCLDSDLYFIDILDPNNTIALNTEIQTLSQKNLRVLAAYIANLDAFICADTGPMHLASSAKTPTVALFKTTSPALYGTLGEKDLSIVIRDKSIEQIARDIIKHLEAVKPNKV